MYKCKFCGATIKEDRSDDEWFSYFGEEMLWGHVQMAHESLFKEMQDLPTPFMLEECYDEEV